MEFEACAVGELPRFMEHISSVKSYLTPANVTAQPACFMEVEDKTEHNSEVSEFFIGLSKHTYS